MIKRLVILVIVLFVSSVNAQIGINSDAPKATLDIIAQTEGNTPEGILIPRLTGNQIKNMVVGGEQISMIIYAKDEATDLDDGSSEAKRAKKITEEGFYYWDGEVWQKVNINLQEEEKVLTYISKTTLIDGNTPTESITTLDNLSIRYKGTSTGATLIQFRLENTPSNVSVWSERMGSGGSSQAYQNIVAKIKIWEDFKSGIFNDMTINPDNRDMIRYNINLHNTKEIYRVTILSNAKISATDGIPSVPAQVTIFIEKL